MGTISKVGIKGIRGAVDRSIELGPRTIITGPNGSGKSTIPVAIEFALLGLIPGYKKGEAIDNAVGDFMGSTVQLGDTVIERTLTRGKTLQERISVNGSTPADAKAATPILEAIIGKSPPILNMPAFWACTPAEKRRMMLRLVADTDTQKSLSDAEAKARAAKNELADTRRGAEKSVASLTASLVAIEKPTGNLDALKDERTEIEKDREAVRKRVSTGEANDKARVELTGMIEATPLLEAEIARLEKAKDELDGAAAKLAQDRTALGDRPVMPSIYGLGDAAQAVVSEAIVQLQEFTTGKKKAAEVIDTLLPLLPDAETDRAITDTIEIYERNLSTVTEAIAAAQCTVRDFTTKIASATGRLESAKDAAAKIAGIGPGLDENDKALRDGLDKRLADVKARIAPLEEIAVLVREIEKANLAAQEAIANEEAAKEALDASIQAQSKIVDAASDMLAVRSKSILPYGNLRMEDDGKDVIISWAKSPTVSIRRTTLSGGEQALFDNALGHSLAPDALIVIEAAEIDSTNMPLVMEHITTHCDSGAQVVMLTCHTPAEIPEGWTHIDMAAVNLA